MGKTFRRGGAERGYYSQGKSLRDKRQKGTNRSVNEFKENSGTSKKKYEHYYEDDRSWNNN